MADTEPYKAEFEAWARVECNLPFYAAIAWNQAWTKQAWKIWQASALASRPAEVDEMRKPPRTAEEMIACIGGHYNSMYLKNDPEDIGFSLTVHDLLSAMRDWFEDYEFEDEPAAVSSADRIAGLERENADLRFNIGELMKALAPSHTTNEGGK